MVRQSVAVSNVRGGDLRRRSDPPELFLSTSEISKLRAKGFILRKKLSQGVSAKIYLTEYQKTETEVITMACKVIDKKGGEHRFVNKFLPREVAILSRIDCSHCIQVYNIIEFKSKCFVFMKLAGNGDLLDYLSVHGATEETHARMWIRQLLLAIKYLHSKQIAHRDIKCENILITTNMNAKLGDFGFSRYWTNERKEEVLSETYCGSISYAAPEILAGSPYLPKYCDIWSLGVVFFIMTNMTKPFHRRKANQLLQQQVDRDFKFRPRAERALSIGAKEVIRRMLEPDVRFRATADSILDSAWMKHDIALVKMIPDIESHVSLDVKRERSTEN